MVAFFARIRCWYNLRRIAAEKKFVGWKLLDLARTKAVVQGEFPRCTCSDVGGACSGCRATATFLEKLKANHWKRCICCGGSGIVAEPSIVLERMVENVCPTCKLAGIVPIPAQG